MILTCPACATQYTVKDGAIPPGGRQVRCASCKHSWHQDVDAAGATDQRQPETGIAPPPPNPVVGEAPLADIPDEAAAEGLIAEEPQPEVDQAPAGNHAPGLDDYTPPAEALEAPAEDDYAEQEFGAIPAMRYEDEPRRGRLAGWLIGLVLLVVAAAAAFWFLAPPEYKARIGIAEAGATQLELMLTTSDRQKLASGNELLAISGRIINPTDREQAVPPIHAELRNKDSKQLVYRWTIAPPARSLPPRGSAPFNSAEVNIPEGGDELTVTLGGTAG
ncbi:MAG: zinc-ribbon domain-containing protein [Pseudomonadota bacterium]|nr:zinc-ribbon domain-containing protein [Pseudomonadota bacterium]